MAQKVYTSYKAQDSSFEMNRAMLAGSPQGLYFGFDVQTFQNDMILRIDHNDTGIKTIELGGTESVPFAWVKMPQGQLVEDDATFELPINPTGVSPRIDYVICTHEYITDTVSPSATFSILQGGGTLPAFSVVLGTLYLPANCTALNQTGVIYTRKFVPNLSKLDEYFSSLQAFKYDKTQPDYYVLDTADYADGWGFDTSIYPFQDKVRIRLTQDSTIVLGGVVKVDNAGVGNNVMFVIPDGLGLRPSKIWRIPVQILRGTTFVNALMSVEADGDCSLDASTYIKQNGDLIFLDGIRFDKNSPL
jgi:hypothetical protein